MISFWHCANVLILNVHWCTGVFIHTLVCFSVCAMCFTVYVCVYSVCVCSVVQWWHVFDKVCEWGTTVSTMCTVFFTVYLYMCIVCVCAQCNAVVTYVVFDRHAGAGLLQQQGCGCGGCHLHLSQSGGGQSRLYSTVQPDAWWVTVCSHKRSLCLHCYVSTHCKSSLLCEYTL